MDEVALIQAAVKGDLEAFNVLVLAYQNLAYNHAYRLLGEASDAEDATQDAFILAYQHLPSFRGGSFRAWLMRILTNVAYDELRRRKSRRTVPLEPLDVNDDEIESPPWIIDPGESPESTAERGELGRAIQDHLNELSPDLRAVVVLIDIQGFDYLEAAAALKVPIGTVKSRLARARLRMRNSLHGSREILPSPFALASNCLS